MWSENVRIVRAMYEAFARGDVEMPFDCLDTNVEWHEAKSFLYADRGLYRSPVAR
jgi:uncharacterized protein